MDFPQPEHVSAGSTRWAAWKLIRWERSQGIDLPAPEADMLSVQRVARRYGVGKSTIWRWTAKARDGATAGVA